MTSFTTLPKAKSLCIGEFQNTINGIFSDPFRSGYMIPMYACYAEQNETLVYVAMTTSYSGREVAVAAFAQYADAVDYAYEARMSDEPSDRIKGIVQMEIDKSIC